MARRPHLNHLICIFVGLLLPVAGPACASTIFVSDKADNDLSSAAMSIRKNSLIQPIAELRPPRFDEEISISPNILRLDDSMTMIVVTPEVVLAAQVPQSSTPAPASLPLFAAGLGVLGFLGWHRKRKLRTAAVKQQTFKMRSRPLRLAAVA